MARIRWQLPTERPRTIVLLVHGLNLKPRRMEELAELCRERGAATGILVLPGHDGDWRRLAAAGPGAYFQVGTEALQEVGSRRRELGVSRVRLVAMSLGALVMLRVLSEAPDLGGSADRGSAPFDDAILLSPALVLRKWARILRGPACLLPGWTPIISFSRRRDRVFATLPAAAYCALYRLTEELRSALARQALPLPMRIYMSRRDELLSVDGTAQLIASGALANAKLIDGSEGRGEGPSHLLVDRASMGPALWDDLLSHL